MMSLLRAYFITSCLSLCKMKEPMQAVIVINYSQLLLLYCIIHTPWYTVASKQPSQFFASITLLPLLSSVTSPQIHISIQSSVLCRQNIFLKALKTEEIEVCGYLWTIGCTVHVQYSDNVYTTLENIIHTERYWMESVLKYCTVRHVPQCWVY